MVNRERDVAAVLHGIRDVRIGEVERSEPGAGEVRVAVHGVSLCGSDLHYYADGRNGTNVLARPTVLGHEGFGVVTEVGPGVDPGRLGQRVALEPAIPPEYTPLVLSGRYNVDPGVVCFGSPPNHGLLRSSVVTNDHFAHALPDGVADDVAALIEPLAVAVWAADRAGSVLGRRVLIAGAGPIGLLVLQVVRALGAAEVTVVDVSTPRLDVARTLGADAAVLSDDADHAPGSFDVAFDCSGHPAAVADAARALGPGGVLVLVGVPSRADAPFPIGAVQRWELDVRGSFRYGPGAFARAIGLASRGRIDLARLVTSRYSLADTTAALDAALTDRNELKIVIDITTTQGHA